MVGIFEKNICICCKNTKCNHRINIEQSQKGVFYKCEEYIKNEKKLTPYNEPLIVTAKRDYVNFFER